MAGIQEQTNELWWNRPQLFWQENQVTITFHSSLDRAAGAEQVIASLKLGDLDQFLQTSGFHLQSFTAQDVPHPEDTFREELEKLEAELAVLANDLNSTTGKYLFRPPSGQGTIVVCFFHGQSTNMASSLPDMGSMHRGGNESPKSDTTRAIVTLINHNLDKLRQDGQIPILAAMPNWIGGGTPPVGHPCPVDPPMPVLGSETCASHPGNWPITLPELSDTMQKLTGDGVTVFVLDTIPTLETIRAASQSAGDYNLLLKHMVDHMDSKIPSITPPPVAPASIIIDHQWVPNRLTGGIQTGKDIYHRLFGFKMPDHGLFVAGIIHDLAPKARIECVRVLNDSGIGDFAVICKALEDIQTRMETEAIKLGQVVVNMSLVVTPGDDELPGHWFTDSCYPVQVLTAMMNDCKLLRVGLHLVIQSLTAQGAVLVASAGNESNADSHTTSMGIAMAMGMKMPTRFGPRHPAAFPEVISVGAVDKDEKATFYSNYPALPPQHNGIATHGGSTPAAVPPATLPPSAPPPPPGANTWGIVTDAIIGVYSAPTYPKLSATDPLPLDYPSPPESHAWAYWSGTSFATPVISAVSARLLQGLKSGSIVPSMSVQDTITTTTGRLAILKGGTQLKTDSAFGVGVGILKAEQVCHPIETKATPAETGPEA
jgi:hypothetical protein